MLELAAFKVADSLPLTIQAPRGGDAAPRGIEARVRLLLEGGLAPSWRAYLQQQEVGFDFEQVQAWGVGEGGGRDADEDEGFTVQLEAGFI